VTLSGWYTVTISVGWRHHRHMIASLCLLCIIAVSGLVIAY